MAILKWLDGGTSGAASKDMPAMPGPFRGIMELRPGQAWRSADGRTVLQLCDKGRLSLLLDGKAAWKPPTRARAMKLLLDGRGQMILFSPTSEKLWAAGKPGASDTELHLQGDGNAVLYSGHHVLWNSDTRLT